jgi:hypothetical protein
VEKPLKKLLRNKKMWFAKQITKWVTIVALTNVLMQINVIVWAPVAVTFALIAFGIFVYESEDVEQKV